MSLLSLLADLSFICLPRSEKERDGIRRRHFLTPTFLAKFTGKKTFNFIVKQKNIIQWERWQGFLPKLKNSCHCTLSSIHCLPFLSNIEDKIQRNTRLIKTAPSGKWKALVSENRVESKDFSLSASFPPSSTSFTQWLAQWFSQWLARLISDPPEI